MMNYTLYFKINLTAIPTLKLLLFSVFIFFEVTAEASVIDDYSSFEEIKIDPRPVDSNRVDQVIITERNAFDYLFDTDSNKELLKSEDYRTTLARSLIYQGKIKDLVTVDGLIFKRIGIEPYLLKVLDKASKLVLKFSDANRRNLYFCLIDATIAGLESSASNQKLWYERAFKHHMSIDVGTREFRESQLIGIASNAQAMWLSNDIYQAEQSFLQGVSQINRKQVGKDDYYLLFKYVNFITENKAIDVVEDWLKFTLSLAEGDHNNYYKSLAYYHLLLLKMGQGRADMSAKYLREYQLAKTKLKSKELIKITFIESSYYDSTSGSFIVAKDNNAADLKTDELVGEQNKELINTKENRGIEAFFGLVTLIVGGAIGISIYLRRSGKNDKGTVSNPNFIGDNQSTLFIPNRILELKYESIESELTSDFASDSVDFICELKRLAENNDPLFMKKFKQFFRDFAECVGKKAETPLNLAELEVCAYTKLGYTTKEVAYYRGDSIRSVENRKYRIRRKLNLPRDVDFTDWVLTA